MSKSIILCATLTSLVLVGWSYYLLQVAISGETVSQLKYPEIEYINTPHLSKAEVSSIFIAPHYQTIADIELARKLSVLEIISRENQPSINAEITKKVKDYTMSNVQKHSSLKQVDSEIFMASTHFLPTQLIGSNEIKKNLIEKSPEFYPKDQKSKLEKRTLVNKGLLNVSHEGETSSHLDFQNTTQSLRVMKNKILENLEKTMKSQVPINNMYAFESIAPTAYSSLGEPKINLHKNARSKKSTITIIEAETHPAIDYDLDAVNQIVKLNRNDADEPRNINLYISVGIYKNSNNLERNVDAIMKAGYPVQVKVINIKNKQAAKLLSGPFKSKQSARHALKSIIDLGFIDAYM